MVVRGLRWIYAIINITTKIYVLGEWTTNTMETSTHKAIRSSIIGDDRWSLLCLAMIEDYTLTTAHRKELTGM